jgi:hypothetical protein
LQAKTPKKGVLMEVNVNIVTAIGEIVIFVGHAIGLLDNFINNSVLLICPSLFISDNFGFSKFKDRN